jgi:PhnB protein
MIPKTYFAPHLTIGNGITDVTFYERAFNCKELRRFTNDDGSIHVVEFELNGMLFHLHEEMHRGKEISPATAKGTTVLLGLMVEDVHAVVDSAIAAGAKLLQPVQDYEYGLRQGKIEDPFGHQWLIEKDLR